MMNLNRTLGVIIPLITTALVSGPVYAHEGAASHGLTALILPVGLLVLALVLMKRHLANQRRR